MHPVYLLLGPEDGEKAQYLKNLREECRSLCHENPEIHRFYPFETEQGEAIQALRNHSLFASHQLVIISQVESLNAAQTAMIIDYIAAPSSASTLVLISHENTVDRKLAAAIPKGAQKIFWELYENRKQEWIEAFFRRYQLEISDNAIDLLLELVENNTSDLRSTCGQLALYYSSREETPPPSAEQRTMPTREITEADVEQFIYHSRKENVFTLFGCIADGDLRRSIDIFRTLHYSGEAEPPALFAGLLWQFRRLYSFSSLTDDGLPESEAFSRAAVLGKSAAVRGKKNQQIYRKAAALFTLREIGMIIAMIGRCDVEVREFGSALQPILMEKFLYDCIVNKGNPSPGLTDTFASFMNSGTLT